MFYLVLFALILLGLIVLATVGLNIGTLWTGVRLNLLVGHPNIPVLLLCLMGAFLGALLLYVVSTFSARRDAREIKELRARIEELEQPPARTPSSGPLASGFAPPPVAPVVPIPGFSPSGSLAQQPLPGSSSGSGSLSNMSPSSSGISNQPFPPRQGPPPLPQPGGPRPPFFQQ